MILIFRKYIVKLLLYLSVLSLLALSSWLILNRGASVPSLSEKEQIWWTFYNETESNGMIKVIALEGQLLFALTFSFILSRRIKRNPSAELSFFSIFLFSFSLQIFRMAYVMDGLPHFFTDGGLTTRIIYFSRILALCALFAASLFSTGLQIQKFGIVLLISLLTAFTLSTLLPINSSVLTGAWINRIAREKHLALFCLTLEVLTVLNYISAGFQEGRSEFLRLALFSLMLIVGYELLFFLNIAFLLPGFLCLIPSTAFYIRTNRKLFLWS